MYTREARVERQTTACRANNSNLVIEVEPLSVVIVEVDWVGFASHLYHPCHEFAGCCRSCTTNSRSDAVLKSGECIQFQLNIQRNAARAATYFANRAASKPCASARRVDARRRRWGFFFISRQSPRVSFTFWAALKSVGALITFSLRRRWRARSTIQVARHVATRPNWFLAAKTNLPDARALFVRAPRHFLSSQHSIWPGRAAYLHSLRPAGPQTGLNKSLFVHSRSINVIIITRNKVPTRVHLSVPSTGRRRRPTD